MSLILSLVCSLHPMEGYFFKTLQICVFVISSGNNSLETSLADPYHLQSKWSNTSGSLAGGSQATCTRACRHDRLVWR